MDKLAGNISHQYSPTCKRYPADSVVWIISPQLIRTSRSPRKLSTASEKIALVTVNIM